MRIHQRERFQSDHGLVLLFSFFSGYMVFIWLNCGDACMHANRVCVLWGVFY